MTAPTGEGETVIDVVAAVRIREGRYWVCRRTDDGSHGGLTGMWEYPGGKVEAAETLEVALRREMDEEFGVQITVYQRLDSITTTLGAQSYRVTLFHVHFHSEPTLRCHDQSKWCTVEELQRDEHLPSGVEFNRRLLTAPPTGDLREAAEELVKFAKGSGDCPPPLEWLATLITDLSTALASQPVETKGRWEARCFTDKPDDWWVNSHGPFTEPQARGVADKLNELEPK